MNKRNILVTAVGGRSVGSGILHALTRSSPEVRDRWNVVAADADSFSWGLYKVEQNALLPFASAPCYIEKVSELVGKLNIHAIIPGSEPEAAILSKNKHLFRVPIIANEYELMPLMTDKFKAIEKLKELGLPSIPTFKAEEYEFAMNSIDFPVIVKPTTGTGGSKGVSLCVNLEELKVVIEKLPAQSGFCIQPLIGTDDSEYTVGVLTDKNGTLIDSLIMKRKLVGLSLLDSKKIGNTRYSISTGYSQGTIIKDEKIRDFCESLALAIGSKGPLNIQLRIHNGQIYVFEIHPRFSGTSTIRADVGFNEPDILLRNHLDNEKFNRIDYRYNVAAIRAFEHVIVPIDKML
jgi:carbamoyl-phosphate synthase large subunit